MTPQLWIIACVFIFLVSFVGQLIRRNRHPWLLPLVAAGGFAVCMLVLTKFVLPRMQEALMGGVQRATERSR
jgi:hypothetical protein